MPVFTRGAVEIHYEEFGKGFPVLLFAPGGLRSSIPWWHANPDGPPRPWMDPTIVLAKNYRVIAMDQRNAGQSRAPITASDGWNSYADDHIALLDHLGCPRAHLMGGCIGSSFALTLCKRVPQRIASAVLQNPIGFDNNRHVFGETFKGWGAAMRERDPGLTQETLDAFFNNMFGGDFAFSVTRDDVKSCTVPLLDMPGDDPPHPKVVGEEIGALAPRVEILRAWKGPEHLGIAINVVTAFLQRHTPR